jgi:hypothetical protein
MATVIGRKYLWAVQKHATALAGTVFAGKCANCPGTTGKLTNGKMGCSRAGAAPVLITEAQAKRCDGRKPPLTLEVSHKPSGIVAKAALANCGK